MVAGYLASGLISDLTSLTFSVLFNCNKGLSIKDVRIKSQKIDPP